MTSHLTWNGSDYEGNLLRDRVMHTTLLREELTLTPNKDDYALEKLLNV